MQQLCPSSRLREGSHAKGSGGSFRVPHSQPEDGRCPRTGAFFRLPSEIEAAILPRMTAAFNIKLRQTGVLSIHRRDFRNLRGSFIFGGCSFHLQNARCRWPRFALGSVRFRLKATPVMCHGTPRMSCFQPRSLWNKWGRVRVYKGLHRGCRVVFRMWRR